MEQVTFVVRVPVAMACVEASGERVEWPVGEAVAGRMASALARGANVHCLLLERARYITVWAEVVQAAGAIAVMEVRLNNTDGVCLPVVVLAPVADELDGEGLDAFSWALLSRR